MYLGSCLLDPGIRNDNTDSKSFRYSGSSSTIMSNSSSPSLSVDALVPATAVRTALATACVEAPTRLAAPSIHVEPQLWSAHPIVVRKLGRPIDLRQLPSCQCSVFTNLMKIIASHLHGNGRSHRRSHSLFLNGDQRTGNLLNPLTDPFNGVRGAFHPNLVIPACRGPVRQEIYRDPGTIGRRL